MTTESRSWLGTSTKMWQR